MKDCCLIFSNGLCERLKNTSTQRFNMLKVSSLILALKDVLGIWPTLDLLIMFSIGINTNRLCGLSIPIFLTEFSFISAGTIIYVGNLLDSHFHTLKSVKNYFSASNYFYGKIRTFDFISFVFYLHLRENSSASQTSQT